MAVQRRWSRFGLGSMMLLISVVAILIWVLGATKRGGNAAWNLLRAGQRPIFDSDAKKSWESVAKEAPALFPASDRPDWVLSKREMHRREKITLWLGRDYADTVIVF